MDKFYVYVFKQGDMPKLVHANNVDVFALFKRSKETIYVVRPDTDQVAVPVGEIVLWQDIKEEALKEASGFQGFQLENQDIAGKGPVFKKEDL